MCLQPKAEHEAGQSGRGEGQADVLRHAHEGGGAAPDDGGEPFANAADAGGIEGGFADAEHDAQCEEGGKAANEAGEQLRGGPEGEAGAEHGARAQAVEHADEGKLREAVGEGEGAEQEADLGGAEMHLGTDGGVGDGEGRAVKKIDDAGKEEQREGDGLVAAQGAGFGRGLHAVARLRAVG